MRDRFEGLSGVSGIRTQDTEIGVEKMTLEEFQHMLGLIEIYVNPRPGDEATTYDQWMREEADEMDKENILLIANAVKRSVDNADNE